MNNIFYGNKGFLVNPISMLSIAKGTKAIRLMNPDFIDSFGRFDVVRYLELVYKNFKVVEDSELPNVYALTLPDGTIILKQSVYDGAAQGEGRDRFTIAHELGHCFLHLEQAGMAREAQTTDKPYCNSEWQANEFAAQLLLPFSYVKKLVKIPTDKLATIFGVSKQCAEYRKEKLSKYQYLA